MHPIGTTYTWNLTFRCLSAWRYLRVPVQQSCFRVRRMQSRCSGTLPWHQWRNYRVIKWLIIVGTMLDWHLCWPNCSLKARSDKLQICCNQRLLQAIAVKIKKFPIIYSDLALCDSCCNLWLVWTRLNVTVKLLIRSMSAIRIFIK